MKQLLILVFFFPLLLFSQLQEDFSDGDFSNNPQWTGTVNLFQINGDYQLQLNDSAEGQAWLSTEISSSSNMEWRCWVKLSFSPSANNNGRLYLLSDGTDLNQTSNAYYIQLGESGSSDAIELFHQNGEDLISICRGTEALLSASFEISLKIVRNEAGNWTIYADPSGGIQYQWEAQGTDTASINMPYFGVFCKYTKSNSSKFYFDDFYAGPIYVDSIAPELQSVEVTNDSSLFMVFDEVLDPISASLSSNFLLDPDGVEPATAEISSQNASALWLHFNQSFINGTNYHIYALNIEDLSGNKHASQSLGFNYYKVQPHDVEINEIMADPSPPLGLPDYEYLELLNRTDQLIDLNQWTLTIGSSIKTFENLQMPAQSFLIVAKETASGLLSTFGVFHGFESFSLTNSGQSLVLADGEGNVISAISYDASWYDDQEKSEGGWSLEQINPANICSSADNWRASIHASGGTPGTENSVINNVLLHPQLDIFEVTDNKSIRLQFSQLMDGKMLANPSNYVVDEDIGMPNEAMIQDNNKELMLAFMTAFQPGVIYQLKIAASLQNCMGIAFASDTIVRFGLAEPPITNDIIINEVLFNPLNDGVDYVEIHNRSHKIIDLSLFKLGTVSESPPNPPDTTFYSISTSQQLLMPAAYALLTSDPKTVQQQYVSYAPSAFIAMSPFPSYKNESGIVLLSTTENMLIDAFGYHEDMHYPLLQYVDGVSLERTHINQPTQDENNWHSAAQSVGFGTPAYQNSQFISDEVQSDEVNIVPEIFSPDNDGYNDIMSINYQFDQPGYMMNVQIYNASGQAIRKLVNNHYLGTSGSVNWDGLMDNNSKAAIGIYIIYIEVFDTNGNVKKFKKTAVVGGKL